MKLNGHRDNFLEYLLDRLKQDDKEPEGVSFAKGFKMEKKKFKLFVISKPTLLGEVLDDKKILAHVRDNMLSMDAWTMGPASSKLRSVLNRFSQLNLSASVKTYGYPDAGQIFPPDFGHRNPDERKMTIRYSMIKFNPTADMRKMSDIAEEVINSKLKELGTPETTFVFKSISDNEAILVDMNFPDIIESYLTKQDPDFATEMEPFFTAISERHDQFFGNMLPTCLPAIREMEKKKGYSVDLYLFGSAAKGTVILNRSQEFSESSFWNTSNSYMKILDDLPELK